MAFWKKKQIRPDVGEKRLVDTGLITLEELRERMVLTEKIRFGVYTQDEWRRDQELTAKILAADAEARFTTSCGFRVDQKEF